MAAIARLQSRMSNPASIPETVGIIMDGNRRWAKARGLPTFEGHRAGLAKAKEIIKEAFDSGVKNVILYAFSTENWNRTAEEVSYLMSLFEQAIKDEFKELATENVRVRFIGEITRLPGQLQKVAHELEEETKSATRGTLAIALSYGGRPEIVSAVNSLIQAGHETVSEAEISSALWTHDIPDPDLIIRTSGEYRLSNFLTWQGVYSELHFTDTLWPDFSKEELHRIFDWYAARDRRHGK